MSWLAVDKSNQEYVYKSRPTRCELEDLGFGETGEWASDRCHLWLPNGSIKRLIGRELTWEDEPVEFTEVIMCT